LPPSVRFEVFQRTNFILPDEVADRLDSLASPRLKPIGKKPIGGKPIQGFEAPLYDVDAASRFMSRRYEAQLLAALKELDPYAFEGVIGARLERLGYQDATVTSKGNDKGIDVIATLRLEGMTEVPTVIQAKRFTTRNVDGATVRQLRGALMSGQHGVIMTTSGFTKDAITEARAAGKRPIALVDGAGVVDLLLKKGLGVKTRLVPLFTLSPDTLLADVSKD
jgi:restriction endonuclease Mrr